jgi:predicted RecA/RadA family phage recombinase
VAENRVFETGERLELPVIAGTVSGSPVIVGMLPGVALTSRDAAGKATCQIGSGVVSVTITGAIATVGLPASA